MSALELFEADLRFKVDIKCPSGQMEERFLVKSFGFFDFRRDGSVDFTQFYKTLEKIGVVATKSNAEKIFNLIIEQGYGHEGGIDYRAYAKKVYNPASFDMLDNQVHKPLATTVYEPSYPKHHYAYHSEQASARGSPAKSVASQQINIKRSGYKEKTSDTVETIIDELRQRIKMRGAKGFIGLQRQFVLTDTKNLGTVNQYEFSKILREYDLNLLEPQYFVLYNAFDRRKDGQIDYVAFKGKGISVIF